jgi:hypothetical protein
MPGAGSRARAAAALAFGLLAAVTPADGGNVPLHRVPGPVLDTIRARFADARILGADRDIEGGTVVYEVAIRQGGQSIDATVTPEGALVLIKTEIAATGLPAPVAAALERRYPGATYKVVEEVVTVRGEQETPTSYEVLLVTTGRRTQEVRITVDGSFLEEER